MIFLLRSWYSIYFELPVMIVIISLVYSGTRYDSWDAIFREAFRWGIRMVLFLVGIVLILTGVAHAEWSMAMRCIISGIGVAVEVSLLFLK